MNSNKRGIGEWGERVAADYLQARGYRVIARNVRTPYGEIDIVTEKDGLTVLIEVKTRTSRSLGPPEMAVTARKREHMLASAAHFAQENRIDHWQIDVIAVTKETGRKPELAHFERALE